MVLKVSRGFYLATLTWILYFLSFFFYGGIMMLHLFDLSKASDSFEVALGFF